MGMMTLISILLFLGLLLVFGAFLLIDAGRRLLQG
jgi:hypothetical protein